MSEEVSTIKKAASFADSWWKIITVVAGLVFGIYNISTAWIEIKETKARLEELKQSIIKDNAFRDDRSDKRYERATLMYEELKKQGLQMSAEIKEHELESAYNRGKYDAQLQILLNKK